MPAQPHQPTAPSARLPLYRREPWLAVLLLAFIVMIVGLFLPVEHRRLPVIVSGILGAGGLVLLVFHRPDPHNERHWREIRLPDAPDGGRGRRRAPVDDDEDDVERSLPATSV